MTQIVRGPLSPPSDAPAVGEWSEEVARVGGVVVEQVLRGALAAPLEYRSRHASEGSDCLHDFTAGRKTIPHP
jgi:hypothetical protein